jgi:hypothetical protein
MPPPTCTTLTASSSLSYSANQVICMLLLISELVPLTLLESLAMEVFSLAFFL